MGKGDRSLRNGRTTSRAVERASKGMDAHGCSKGQNRNSKVNGSKSTSKNKK